MSSSGHLYESVDDLKEYQDFVVVYTRLCFEWFGIQIPVWVRDLFLLRNIQIGSRAHTAPDSVATGDLFQQ